MCKWLTYNPEDSFRAKEFAKLMQLTIKKKYDSKKFLEKLYLSDKTQELLSNYLIYDWCDETFLLAEFENLVGPFETGKVLDSDVLWFAGYLYEWWVFTRKEKPSKVYTILSIEKLVAGYAFWHTQDWDFVIDEAINMYENDLWTEPYWK